MSSLLKEEEVQLFRFSIRSPMAVESDNEHVRVPRFAVVFRWRPKTQMPNRFQVVACWFDIGKVQKLVKDLQLEPLQPEGTTGIKMNQNGVWSEKNCSVIWIFLKLAFWFWKNHSTKSMWKSIEVTLVWDGEKDGKGEKPARFFQLKPFQVVSSGGPTIQAPRSRLGTCTFWNDPSPEARTLLGSGTGWKRPSLECYPVPNDASKTQCWLP